MRTARLVPLLALAAVAALVVLWPTRPGDAGDIAPVEVVNLPEVQQVEGTVTVGKPIPQARLVHLGSVVVSPVTRQDTTSLIEAGRVETDGFTHVVLSLRGEVQGKLAKEGAVGAILLPDQEPVVRTFEQAGQYQFPLEVIAPVKAKDRGYFASKPGRQSLAFPAYQVLLYNETDRSVEVDLYAYLTN